ncbi:MAG: hypothetical protein JRH01_18935 [Deltaproteobacteria bacterium]|nr:hypothetical protein [Deltaproteobacteria bacterium]MBW2393995.1 hypothetical protein [Deltaproteobacteria bacterium]
MRRTLSCIAALAIVALAAAPAAAQSRRDKNQVVSVKYGTVIGIEVVKLESDAGKGAILGGLIGLIASRGKKKTKRAATGVAVGGIGTRVLEGSNEAFEYTVRLNAGQDIRMITDQTGMRLDDCVSVEQGRSGNIRRVSRAHCEAGSGAPTADHHQEADACQLAKLELSAATDDEAIDRAIYKARILCED